MFVKLTNVLAAIFAWVLKAASTEGWNTRLFRAISFKNGWLASCDGTRLHAVQINSYRLPEGIEVGKAYCFDPFSRNASVATATESLNFPDISKAIPTSPPDAEFFANPKYLIDALGGLEGGDIGMVRICLYANRESAFKIPATATPEERARMIAKRKNEVKADNNPVPADKDERWPSHSPVEVFGFIKDQPAYALIMPKQEGNHHTWKPTFPQEPPAEPVQ